MAVFASLVYLAVQTRQNTRALRSSAFHQIRESFSQVSMVVTEDPSLVDLISRAAQDSGDLTEAEIARFHFFVTTFLRRGESAYFQSSEGALEKESWEGIRTAIKSVLSNRYGKQYWKTQSDRFTSSYAAVIDQLVSCDDG
jgi:hypothetical protein